MSRIRASFVILSGLFSLIAFNSFGAEIDKFHNTLDQVNSSYKSAMNYLHTGNIAFAGMELETAIDRSKSLQKLYQNNPPGPYSSDPKWKNELSGITDLLQNGLEKLDQGDVEETEKSLATLRSKFHELRIRNGVTLFQDEYQAVTSSMKGLYRYRRTEITAEDKAIWKELELLSVQFHKAILASDARATKEMIADGPYQRLMGIAKASSPAMTSQIRKRNHLGFINYLRELKSVERMLYLHYG
ncbi:MAG: hypothetical protein MI743_05850 [Sneathiellales bacterium]|nr:hypothetical protein [Sneathiellales bacterium]